ncbi:MAG: hypothetical protein JRJ54_14740 [Deltaproteobacteria bacterium]|nr:hypothetical protein [Deltaproteobacteria bacterium]
MVDPNYQAYLAEVRAQMQAPREPLLSLEIDDKGRVKKLDVTLPPERVEVVPYQPKIHPGWTLAGHVVRAGATVAGIGIVADAVTDIVKMGGHNNYYADSFNSVGRDYNHLHGISVSDKGTFAPTWDYSTSIRDSYNTQTDIRDSFHFGSHNSYDLDGDGAQVNQGNQSWLLGEPWNVLD